MRSFGIFHFEYCKYMDLINPFNKHAIFNYYGEFSYDTPYSNSISHNAHIYISITVHTNSFRTVSLL